MKQIRANDSVRFPHVKVGHRQGFIPNVCWAIVQPAFKHKSFVGWASAQQTLNHAGVAQLVEQLTCNQ